jgi:hypothetical protein
VRGSEKPERDLQRDCEIVMLVRVTNGTVRRDDVRYWPGECIDLPHEDGFSLVSLGVAEVVALDEPVSEVAEESKPVIEAIEVEIEADEVTVAIGEEVEKPKPQKRGRR